MISDPRRSFPTLGNVLHNAWGGLKHLVMSMKSSPKPNAQTFGILPPIQSKDKDEEK